MSNRKPVLAVVYDYGSMPPTWLAKAAARNECELVFSVAGSRHAREMAPLLTLLGPVIDMGDRPITEIAADLCAFQPTGIVTFSEFQIETTARLAGALKLGYHALADVGAIVRKDAQRRRLAAAGIDTVRFHIVKSSSEVDEAIERVGLPAIIKPVEGTSSRNTAAADTLRECRELVARMLGECGGQSADLTETAVVLEEFITGISVARPWGDYLTVNCLANGDDITPLFVMNKFDVAEPFRERGGYCGRSVLQERSVREAVELSCRSVRALNIQSGISDVEVKLTEHGPRLIEVNGRLGGWVADLAFRSSGMDVADAAISSALGSAPKISPQAANDRLVFHYVVVPPAWASRVRSIHGVAQLRRLEHVEQVLIRAEAGGCVDWRLGGRSSVAAVLGATDTHEQLAATIAAVEDLPWIEYE